jgi:Mrp family chromosome partitioning ATPase
VPERLPSLTIRDANDAPAVSFPGELIENLRYMITRLGQRGELPTTLSMVAALRQEGVTSLSLALAATIANDLMARLCVVELNWWWPSTSPLVSPGNRGLAAVIANEAGLDEVIVSTGWPNLSLLPAGDMPRDNRPVVARSLALKDTLKELSQRFDYLILDIPAILATNDAIPLAALGSASCLVIRQGVTSVEDVRLALDDIAQLKILGTVLNRAKLSTPPRLVKLISTR